MIGRSLKLPPLHPGQLYILKNAKRYNWVFAGRRWRKTSLAMVVAAVAAVRGETVIWGAPTVDQVKIGFRDLRKAAHEVADFNLSRSEAYFPNNGVIFFRTLSDPDTLRGFSANGVVIDEIADSKEEALKSVLLPMLADTGGWFYGIGTPKGRNWAFREWKAERPDTTCYQIPTLGCRIERGKLVREPHSLENPHFKWEELLKYFKSVPEQTFREEFMAEFIEEHGTVFRKVRENATATREERRQGSWEYVCGVDLAKFLDWSVFSVINVTKDCQCHIERMREIDYTLQLERLINLHNKFQFKEIVVERNSAGEPFIELMEQRGLPVTPFTTTNASKRLVIEALSLALDREELKILDDPTQLDELMSFEVKRLPSGLLRYAAPNVEGLHDDTVIALALAFHAISSIHTIEVTHSDFLWDYRG